MTFRLTFIAMGFDIITKIMKCGLRQQKMPFHAISNYKNNFRFYYFMGLELYRSLF